MFYYKLQPSQMWQLFTLVSTIVLSKETSQQAHGPSSGMWRRVVMFRRSMVPEEGGSMALRNVGILPVQSHNPEDFNLKQAVQTPCQISWKSFN